MKFKKILTIAVVLSSVFCINGCTTETQENNITENATKIEQQKSLGKVTEKPVMNGTKTEQVGTYAVAKSNGIEIDKEILLDFYKNNVENSDYNWITIDLGNGKGIVFAGGTEFIFTYGEIDNEGCITKTLGSGTILNDEIEYQGN